MIDKELANRASNFFGLDFAELEQKAIGSDLYTAISEMTGVERSKVKHWMHGLAYGTENKSLIEKTIK